MKLIYRIVNGKTMSNNATYQLNKELGITIHQWATACECSLLTNKKPTQILSERRVFLCLISEKGFRYVPAIYILDSEGMFATDLRSETYGMFHACSKKIAAIFSTKKEAKEFCNLANITIGITIGK